MRIRFENIRYMIYICIAYIYTKSSNINDKHSVMAPLTVTVSNICVLTTGGCVV